MISTVGVVILRMNNRKIIFRIIGICLIIISFVLILISVQQSQKQICVYPENSMIANIEVGGLDVYQARSQLAAVYEKPIDIQIDQIILNLTNDQIGLSIHYDEMLSGINCDNVNQWSNYWSFIWNKSNTEPLHTEIIYDFDEKILQESIDQLIKPYVYQEPTSSFPISGTTQYHPGISGITLNQEKLMKDIKDQIVSREKKLIFLELIEIPALPPSIIQISDQLKEIIQAEEFNGLIEIFIQRLTDGEKLQLLNWYGEEKNPGVAFTAASTMKIPIMVSTYWRQDLPLSEIMDGWIEYMIVYSENDPADRLMEQIDAVRGPLIVTNDMQALGLENTFIAGFFYLGAPLLNFYQTPANQRTDININPDVYNQTTPEEIGRLLSLIYYCALDDSSQLSKITQGKITREECNLMIDTLAKNRMGALIEAGLPEGIKIAHKHGWSQERDGLVHSFSDVALVFGPENDFVLTIFLHSPNQLLFDTANPLIARISQSIYNGFNPNHQIAWPFPENN